MTFDETLTQILELLQRDGRVSYRALKRRFALDEDYLDDLKAEIIQAKRLAVDEDGAVLVWTGGAIPAPVSASAPVRAPLTYTPAHLAEKIRAARPALEGERKQVAVLFADLKGSTELSTRPGSSRNASIPSSTPSPMKWPTAVCSRRGSVSCTRGSRRLSRRWRRNAWPSRSNA